MPKKFEIEAVFKATDEISKHLKTIQGNLKGFERKTDSLSKRFVGRMGSMAASVAKVGVAALASGGAIAAIGVKNIVEVGAEFEKTMDAVAARMGGIQKGSEAYRQLEKAAMDAGSTTSFSASDAARGLEFLAQAGLKTQQAIRSLPGITKFAAASKLNLAESTDIVVKSLGQFNLMTEDSVQLSKNISRVTDVLAKGADSATVTVQELFDAFVNGAPAAQVVGTSVETTTALLAQMAKSGKVGAEAGTALKIVFERLVAPTETAASRLKQLGVVATKKGKFQGIQKVLAQLSKGLEGVAGDAKKAQILKDIFGADVLASATTLVKSGATESIADLQKKMENAGGSAARLAKQMKNNLSGSMTEFKSKVEIVKLKAFKAMLPVLNRVATGLNGVVNRISEWMTKNKEMLSSGFAKFMKGILFVAGKIRLVIGRIIEGVSSFTAEIRSSVEAAPMMETLRGAFQRVAQTAARLWDFVVKIFMILKEAGIIEFAVKVFGLLGKVFGFIGRVLQPVISVLKVLFKLIGVVLKPVLKFLGAILDELGGLFDLLGKKADEFDKKRVRAGMAKTEFGASLFDETRLNKDLKLIDKIVSSGTAAKQVFGPPDPQQVTRETITTAAGQQQKTTLDINIKTSGDTKQVQAEQKGRKPSSLQLNVGKQRVLAPA